MTHRSRLVQFGLLVLSYCVITNYVLAASWPITGEIDLSSGFGDFRTGRFHAGLDLRTGGVPGKELRSPIDGYISRMRMGYTGYGKGLYLTGIDGYTYVFGHLQGFNPVLEKLVKSRQMQAKRYYVEFELPADSIKVKQGELLGYTGQTGIGAPHLHFEKRTSTNIPLNPLTHGFKLNDKVKPTIERIGFQLTDDHSLFSNADRKIFYAAKPARKGGNYVLDTVLYFNSPFGVLTDCFDQMKTAGMRQTVYKLQLFVDQAQYYQVVMDSIDYGTGASANLIYDYAEAVDGEPRVRRLFHRTGNEYAGTQSYGPGLGVIGQSDQLAYGPHSLSVVAEDANGNRTELTMSFVWGPPGELLSHDSTVVISDTIVDYYFTQRHEAKQLGIVKTHVCMNRGELWRELSEYTTTKLDSQRTVFRLTGGSQSRVVLRLEYTTKTKCRMADSPFQGIVTRGILPVAVSYVLTDDGMIVTGELAGRTAYRAEVLLFFGDSLLGREPARQFFSVNRYAFLVPPRPQYERIDQIKLKFESELPVDTQGVDSLMIVQVGRKDTVRLAVDTLFECLIDSADVYEPRFIDLKKFELNRKGALKLGSDHYLLGPADMLLKAPMTLRLKVNQPSTRVVFEQRQLGLCRLNEAGDKWIWLGNTAAGNQLTATTARGGSYVAVLDIEPPKISGLNVTAQQTLRESQPVFRFKLADDLSGFEDDRNILIKLDSKWQIPEFDMEDGICISGPIEPLTPGEHHLSIEVTDRAGNQAQQYLKFKVAPPLQRAPAKKEKGN